MSHGTKGEDPLEKAFSADIDAWIERIGVVRNDYVICPYARKAWREKQVRIEVVGRDHTRIYEIVESWNDSVEVIIIALETAIAVEAAQDIERELDENYKNIICILDHPDYPGFIDGVYMGNGMHVLFLIQNRKLHSAHVHLLTTDYYEKLSTEYYDEVVKGRYH